MHHALVGAGPRNTLAFDLAIVLDSIAARPDRTIHGATVATVATDDGVTAG